MAEIVNVLREFAKYCTTKSATYSIMRGSRSSIHDDRQEINWSHVHPVGPVPADHDTASIHSLALPVYG